MSSPNMSSHNFRRNWLSLLIAFFVVGMCLASPAEAAKKKPLKVFILVGQSNMEGHAKISTFDYIGDDPKTAPLLKMMRGPDGKPRVADNAWISYYTGRGNNNGEGFGKLTAGYGARNNPSQDGGKIGPEFVFGLCMDKALDEPVLIIKTAWGGKSLYHDFRSPSSGIYERCEQDIERGRYTEEKSGHYYRLMINHVKQVLSDVKRICPEYDERVGYEVAGFVWFQGFNDMVSHNAYPNLPKNQPGNKYDKYGNYSLYMANFIRDVRKDLEIPQLPFIIGVLGVDGMDMNKVNPGNQAFRRAMAAPASLPEFKGNVVAIETGQFWDEPLGLITLKYRKVHQKRKQFDRDVKAGKMTREEAEVLAKKFEAELISPAEEKMNKRGLSNAPYHYLGCAKTFALMGQDFAEKMLTMMGNQKPQRGAKVKVNRSAKKKRAKKKGFPETRPDNGVVLFDGKNLGFVNMKGEEPNWPIEDGAIISTPGGSNMNHLVSRYHFRDANIHVEFQTPVRGSGNSGVYLHGNYELQIRNPRDGKPLEMEDIGSLYGFSKPLVHASLKPGEWQSYDIHYVAPRRDAGGKITRKGYVTAWLNGKLVQKRTRFEEARSSFIPYRHGATPYTKAIWQNQKKTMTGPVFLQDHYNAVKFRNVWIQPLDDHAHWYEPK